MRNIRSSTLSVEKLINISKCFNTMIFLPSLWTCCTIIEGHALHQKLVRIPTHYRWTYIMAHDWAKNWLDPHMILSNGTLEIHKSNQCQDLLYTDFLQKRILIHASCHPVQQIDHWILHSRFLRSKSYAFIMRHFKSVFGLGWEVLHRRASEVEFEVGAEFSSCPICHLNTPGNVRLI